MKRISSVYVIALLLVLSVSLISAPAPTCNDNKGSIWTSNIDCGNNTQDENHYNLGDKVYIRGDNFCAQYYNWTITGQPGGASCDPKAVVASGIYSVGSSGAFCFEAYTVADDDCGEYTVDFANKNDNFRINQTPVVPEFGLVVGGLTAVSAVVLFFMFRRK